MDPDEGYIIEYSIDGSISWHHGRTVPQWVGQSREALAAQRAVVREFAREEHGNVESLTTRVLRESDMRAVNNQPVLQRSSPLPSWSPELEADLRKVYHSAAPVNTGDGAPSAHGGLEAVYTHIQGLLNK